MQIMGQVAREQGFKGVYLSELFAPEINLKLGIGFFKKLLVKQKKEPEELRTHLALQRYNGGGNIHYSEEVFSHITSGRYSEILF